MERTGLNIGADEAARAEAILRRSVVLVWLATGIGVLHPYYREVGGEYLRPTGLPNSVMVATCLGELVLAAVLWFRRTDWIQAMAQTCPVLAFTAILIWVDPLLLVHPFGVLSKNIPLVGVVWAAYLLRREGFSSRAERLLRAAMGVVWLTEGLLPKQIFLSPLEVEVVMAIGVPGVAAVPLIHVAGALQALSGLGVLFLKGRPLKVLLGLLLAGLVFLPLLVTWSHPEMWVHPFGPLTKNFPLLAGTYVLWRRCTPTTS